MTKMQEMQWRKKQKAGSTGAKTPTPGKKAPPPSPGAKKKPPPSPGAKKKSAGGSGGVGEPPPGLTKMQEMAWRKKQKAKAQ